MLALPAIRKIDVTQHASSILDPLVESMGQSRFGENLLTLLNDVCGAEHTTIFAMRSASPFEMLALSRDGTDAAHRQFGLYLRNAYWQSDPTLAAALDEAATNKLAVVQVDIKALPVSDFRNRIYEQKQIRERLLLCGQVGATTIGLSAVRRDEVGLAREDQLVALGQLSSTLLTVVSKHFDLLKSRAGLATALTSLPLIEAVFGSASPRLAGREAEVCARMIFGMSTTGIALDLDIGEQTVMTYRKRAYCRLAIGSQRELLLWYLREWVDFAGRGLLPNDLH